MKIAEPEFSIQLTMKNEAAEVWQRLAKGFASTDANALMGKVVAIAAVVESMADESGHVQIRNPSTGAVRKVALRG